MKKFLIVFPMGVEARSAFQSSKLQTKFPAEGDFIECAKNKNGDEISMLVSGFGCETTRKRITNAIEKTRPDIAILCGCCGACHHDIMTGEMLGAARGEGAEKMLNALGLKPAKFATVNHIAEETEKIALAKDGFDGVEMEGEIVDSEMKKLAPDGEFLHIRTISDGLKAELPMSFLRAIMNFETGKLEITKGTLFKAILKNPTLLYTLPKFAKALAPVQKLYDDFVAQKLLKELNLI